MNLLGYVKQERLTPPTDYENMVMRIGFYFHMSRKEILWGLSLYEFFNYHNNSAFFYLESQGKAPKKPSTFQDKEYHKERKEQLKKVYGVK